MDSLRNRVQAHHPPEKFQHNRVRFHRVKERADKSLVCEEIFSQAELIGRSKTITTTVLHINDSNLVTTDNPVEVRVQEIVCTIDPAPKPQETVRRGGTFHFQTPEDR